jgi:hypothetical protein
VKESDRLVKIDKQGERNKNGLGSKIGEIHGNFRRVLPRRKKVTFLRPAANESFQELKIFLFIGIA